MSDSDDFSAFVDAHLDPVYGFAAARVGRDVADAVVLDVFRSARHTFDRGEGEVLSRSWLLTRTRNRILAHWRLVAERAEPDSAVDAPAPEVRIGTGWNPDQVLDALDRLPGAERAVLALRYLEGRPVAEVAHMIDRPHATTQQLLAKARRAFHALALPTAAPTAAPV